MIQDILKMLIVLYLFAMVLILASCGINTRYQTNSVPCEALTIVRYKSITPEKSEELVLLNNAVIEGMCYDR